MPVPRIHLVEFYKPTETVDNAGSATVSFSLQFRVVVGFRVERDRLTTEGEIRPSGRVAATIRMAFVSTITRGWRVRYLSQDYDVETVRDPFGDRKELELTVVAVEQ
jgi:head-tail adaptor